MSDMPIQPIGPGGARQQESVIQLPSRDSILGFLEAEIARLTVEQQQPGWTKWALSGAFAALGWLLLSEWEAQKYNAINVRVLIIAVALAIPGLAALGFVFYGSSNVDHLQNRAVPLKDLLGPARAAILFTFLKAVLVATLAISVVGPAPVWLMTITVVVAGIEALSVLTSLFAVKTALSIPRIIRINWLLLIWPVLYVFIGGSYAYLLYLANAAPWNSLVPDIRFAALLVVSWVLLTMLLSPPAGAPLINSLVIIRQNLALGRVDVEDATKQIDIALAGLLLEDAVQVELRRLLQISEDYQTGIEQQTKRQRIAEAVLDSFTENTPDDETVKLEAIVHLYKAEHMRLGRLIKNDIPNMKLSLELRLDLLRGTAAQKELETLRSKIEVSFASLYALNRDYEASARDFIVRIDIFSGTLEKLRANAIAAPK